MVAENASSIRLVGETDSAKRRQIIDGARATFALFETTLSGPGAVK